MTVVVSGGRSRRADARAAWPLSSSPVWEQQAPSTRSVALLHGNLLASFESIVRSQPWIFAGITRLCWWGSRIPLGVFSGPEDDPDPQLQGPLVDLVRRPNGRMGWRRLIRDYVMWDYMVHGNALCMKWRESPGAPPSELLPIPWKFVTEITDQAERIIGYTLWIGGEQYPLRTDDVWHSRWPRGIAPLEALARTIAIEDASLEYQANALGNGVTPRASFTTEKILSEADKKRLRAELDKLYAGPEGGGRYALLDKELRYDKPIGVSAVDLALIDQRKLSREEAAAVLDVSPPFLGVLDRATFNNIAELRDMLFRDSVGPKIESLADDFLDQIITPEPVWRGLWVQARMDLILLPSPEALARLELMEQQSSTTSIDDRRARRGKQPYRVKGVTDVPLIPVNMTPAGQTPPPPLANDTQNRLQAELVAAVLAAGNGNGRHDQEVDDEED
jgi:HK97 family phage portal protein